MNLLQNSVSETLQGSVERVTFHSEETGFCVLKIQVKGHREPVTVIGNAATVTAGEYVECRGIWVNDRKHGLQFKTQELAVIQPTTLQGIEKYLGSGMVKGIGPHFAKKLVKAFGVSVFDVIETEPGRLLEVEGIGTKRQYLITDGWAEQKAIREIMVFLQSHGVGTARAVRIYKTYGQQAIQRVSENPYCLALDIRGIGFKTADLLAQRLGIAQDAPIRAEAGVRHVLQEICDQGHCAAREESVIQGSQALLDLSVELIQAAIEHEIAAENLVPEFIEGERCLYPVSLFQAESRAAAHLQRLRVGEPPWGKIEAEKAVEWVEGQTGLKLSPSQREALKKLLDHKLSIMTGGPGVGKTTLINSLIKILQAKKLKISLAAPTGRAAKRLSEATRLVASTLHRLLEFDPVTHGFKHDQNHPLGLDVLIIDESSMIDIVLFNHVLKAIPSSAALVLVGDIDQLPSVGPGAVLSDLIRSEQIATVRLTEIFRQAASSKIILNAHRINQGQMPLPNGSGQSDFFTLFEESTEDIHQTLIQVVQSRLPDHYHCNPITDIQVLTPMNRGHLGSRGLNIDLQKALNGEAEPKITRFGNTYAPGDKVIQTSNNYDKEVFNGDIGFIEEIDVEQSFLTIRFDRRLVNYEFTELDELSLAYAISIHKSQGSEFPMVVLPIGLEHYTLLARNLLYTGITRGKKLVVAIGQKKAMWIAIQNNKQAERITQLAERIKS